MSTSEVLLESWPCSPRIADQNRQAHGTQRPSRHDVLESREGGYCHRCDDRQAPPGSAELGTRESSAPGALFDGQVGRIGRGDHNASALGIQPASLLATRRCSARDVHASGRCRAANRHGEQCCRHQDVSPSREISRDGTLVLVRGADDAACPHDGRVEGERDEYGEPCGLPPRPTLRTSHGTRSGSTSGKCRKRCDRHQEGEMMASRDPVLETVGEQKSHEVGRHSREETGQQQLTDDMASAHRSMVAWCGAADGRWWAKRDSIPQALRCAACRGHPHPRGSRTVPEIDAGPDQRTVEASVDVGEEGLEPPTFRV